MQSPWSRQTPVERDGSPTSKRKTVWAISRWSLGVISAANACTPQVDSPLERAEFGVMFGGQCQERIEIPFELDAAKQTLGFALQLKRASNTPTPIHWEIAKPGPLTNGLSSPLSRRTELFDGVLPAGQRDFRQHVSLNPGDQLGTWNIRVLVGSNVAIDRPFLLFDADKRRVQPSVDAGLE